jgi:murein DD-endopeptidase MepM/ murein hydrolase activator NlpD
VTSSSNLVRAVLLIAVVLAMLTMVPATSARASQTSPPFDVKFPQKASETRFSNTWGARRSGGRRHKGTDLMAEKMTEVYAFADGVVAKVSTSRRAGRYVIIEHAEGWESYYIHLNNDNPGTDDGDAPWYLTLAPGIEEGTEVVSGQLIGWVGDSGNAEGSSPHTHFEVLINGRNINPYNVLDGIFERDLADDERRARLVESQLDGELLIL